MIRIGNLIIQFSFKIDWIKKGFAVGTYSICKDGKHCIFLDYDNFRYEWMVSELKHLQKKYKLSHFYVFKSSEFNHHAVCFDKVNARIYNDIVQDSNCDVLFRNNGFFDLENARVLRFTAKTKSLKNMPYFYKIIKSKIDFYPKSSPHINFFRVIYGIDNKLINYKYQDHEVGLRMISYATKNI